MALIRRSEIDSKSFITFLSLQLQLKRNQPEMQFKNLRKTEKSEDERWKKSNSWENTSRRSTKLTALNVMLSSKWKSIKRKQKLLKCSLMNWVTQEQNPSKTSLYENGHFSPMSFKMGRLIAFHAQILPLSFMNVNSGWMESQSMLRIPGLNLIIVLENQKLQRVFMNVQSSQR